MAETTPTDESAGVADPAALAVQPAVINAASHPLPLRTTSQRKADAERPEASITALAPARKAPVAKKGTSTKVAAKKERMKTAAKAPATRKEAVSKAQKGAPAPAEGHKRGEQLVIYSIDGTPKLLGNRTYSLGYLAAAVIGGAGATGHLRAILAADGVTDPERTEWIHTLENGTVIAAAFSGQTAPPRRSGDASPRPARKATAAKPADKVARLQQAVADAKAIRVAKANGDPIPASAAISAIEADAEQRRVQREAEMRAAAERPPKAPPKAPRRARTAAV